MQNAIISITSMRQLSRPLYDHVHVQHVTLEAYTKTNFLFKQNSVYTMTEDKKFPWSVQPKLDFCEFE